MLKIEINVADLDFARSQTRTGSHGVCTASVSKNRLRQPCLRRPDLYALAHAPGKGADAADESLPVVGWQPRNTLPVQPGTSNGLSGHQPWRRCLRQT